MVFIIIRGIFFMLSKRNPIYKIRIPKAMQVVFSRNNKIIHSPIEKLHHIVITGNNKYNSKSILPKYKYIYFYDYQSLGERE